MSHTNKKAGARLNHTTPHQEHNIKSSHYDHSHILALTHTLSHTHAHTRSYRQSLSLPHTHSLSYPNSPPRTRDQTDSSTSFLVPFSCSFGEYKNPHPDLAPLTLQSQYLQSHRLTHLQKKNWGKKIMNTSENRNTKK